MEFRVGEESDLTTVLGILDEAAGWLWRRGIRQWPERFQADWIASALGRGETWLALLDGAAIGTFTLSWQDNVWPDWPDDAGYLHRLAVLRSAAGFGLDLIDHVGDLALANGRSFVRLDCVASNDLLCRYYERAGFIHRGDVEVRGAAAQLLIGGGESVTVSRYERPIRPDPGA